jgi:plastocyanin
MHRLSPAVLAIAIAVTAIAFAARPTGPVTAAATQEAVVSMQFNRFAPEDVVVAAGSTVTWVNEDYDSGEWHDVIDEYGAFISESFAPGGAFSVTFDVPGVYSYYCDLHEGMYGRVFVE